MYINNTQTISNVVTSSAEYNHVYMQGNITERGATTLMINFTQENLLPPNHQLSIVIQEGKEWRQE